MSASLEIAGFALGPWETNCYVIHPPGSASARVIDAGFEPAPLIAHLRTHALTPVEVLLTHAHADHIAGLHELRALWPDCPIRVHPAERDALEDPEKNLSALLGAPITAPPATGPLEAGETVTVGEAALRVLATPGHSPGGVTLYAPEAGAAFVGDALFAGAIGRTDFPGSDHATLIERIRSELLALPDETVVYPGHGPTTTIGAERASNPFLAS